MEKHYIRTNTMVALQLYSAETQSTHCFNIRCVCLSVCLSVSHFDENRCSNTKTVLSVVLRYVNSGNMLCENCKQKREKCLQKLSRLRTAAGSEKLRLPFHPLNSTEQAAGSRQQSEGFLSFFSSDTKAFQKEIGEKAFFLHLLCCLLLLLLDLSTFKSLRSLFSTQKAIYRL